MILTVLEIKNKKGLVMDTQTKEPSKNTSNEVYKENKENNHNESQQTISAPPHQKSADQEEIDALKDSYNDFLYVSKAFSNCAINSLIAKAAVLSRSNFHRHRPIPCPN